jgi:hypothetical protein
MYSFMTWQTTHNKAVLIGQNFKRSEAELIDILNEVEEDEVYLHLKLKSLFHYGVEVLHLSEDQSLNYIRIARASKVVPAIQEAIVNNTLSLSNARKIASVITPENQAEWLDKGQTLSSRDLQKEIVKTHPEKVLPEKIKPINDTLYELRCHLTPEGEKLLQAALNIVAKNMGQTLEEVLKEFVERHDPVKKAERSLSRKPRQPVTRPPYRNSQRTSIPKPLVHAAMKEAGGKCQEKDPNGKRCTEGRYLQVHHCQPVSLGGKHELSNLIVLCSGHHRGRHFSAQHYASG